MFGLNIYLLPVLDTVGYCKEIKTRPQSTRDIPFRWRHKLLTNKLLITFQGHVWLPIQKGGTGGTLALY